MCFESQSLIYIPSLQRQQTMLQNELCVCCWCVCIGSCKTNCPVGLGPCASQGAGTLVLIPSRIKQIGALHIALWPFDCDRCVLASTSTSVDPLAVGVLNQTVFLSGLHPPDPPPGCLKHLVSYGPPVRLQAGETGETGMTDEPPLTPHPLEHYHMAHPFVYKPGKPGKTGMTDEPPLTPPPRSIWYRDDGRTPR